MFHCLEKIENKYLSHYFRTFFAPRSHIYHRCLSCNWLRLLRNETEGNTFKSWKSIYLEVCMLSLWGLGSHLLSSLGMNSTVALTFCKPIVHSTVGTIRTLKIMQIQPLEARASSILLITYLLSTVVENCTTQCFIKQMWMHSGSFIAGVFILPTCTHNRSNTIHLIFPKLNYKFLVITASPWLWPLTNSDSWVNNHVTTTSSKGAPLIWESLFLLSYFCSNIFTLININTLYLMGEKK